MAMDLESQKKVAEQNARTLREDWFVIKFPNSELFRAVSRRFFASQPQMAHHIIYTYKYDSIPNN